MCVFGKLLYIRLRHSAIQGTQERCRRNAATLSKTETRLIVLNRGFSSRCTLWEKMGRSSSLATEVGDHDSGTPRVWTFKCSANSRCKLGANRTQIAPNFIDLASPNRSVSNLECVTWTTGLEPATSAVTVFRVLTINAKRSIWHFAGKQVAALQVCPHCRRGCSAGAYEPCSGHIQDLTSIVVFRPLERVLSWRRRTFIFAAGSTL
jgi:hypothetical protein